MAHLTFKDVMGINEVKDIALGMIAKDGEVVDFHSDCLCRGPVRVQFINTLEMNYFGLEYLGRDLVEQARKTHAKHDQAVLGRGRRLVRRQTPRAVAFRFPSPGFTLRIAGVVDGRGRGRLHQTRGGLRKRIERLSTQTSI
jgi:hypothetical protein